MMYKDVFAIFARDKAITLLIAEPFNFTFCHYLLLTPFNKKP
jgi:hypothetical protein